jgi:uncharacterized membrane protein
LKPGGALSRAFAALVFVAYPFAVWFALTRWSPRAVALAALALLALRRALAREALAVARESRGALAAVVALCAGAAVSDWRPLLLGVPVVTSAFAAWLFGASLATTPLVERFARAERPVLTGAEVRYCRSVTRLWCAFLAANAALSLALALFAPTRVWALYTGLGFYLLVAALFGAEVAVRLVRFPQARGPLAARFLARR